MKIHYKGVQINQVYVPSNITHDWPFGHAGYWGWQVMGYDPVKTVAEAKKIIDNHAVAYANAGKVI